MRNINFDLKEKHMTALFSKYGTLKDVHVPVKKENNLNKGFAFVEFETREEARKAIEGVSG